MYWYDDDDYDPKFGQSSITKNIITAMIIVFVTFILVVGLAYLLN